MRETPELAEAFSKLLKSVSAGMIKTFRSSDKKGAEGIDFGDEWYKRLMAMLQSTSDVVCLFTERSLDRPWILFEAGALSKKLKAAETRVCTYLHALEYASVNPPLSMFQHTLANKEDTRRLIHDIRKFSKATVTEEGMNKLFDAMWPELELALNAAPPPEKATSRDLREMMAEMLVEVRQSAKDIQLLRSSVASSAQTESRAAVREWMKLLRSDRYALRLHDLLTSSSPGQNQALRDLLQLWHADEPQEGNLKRLPIRPTAPPLEPPTSE